jgi:hypothetical protein
VAQGLHGLLHLDASLQPISTEIVGREAFIKRCHAVLERFWSTAYDKDIDYLLTCREPSGDVHMVKFCGTQQSFTRVDVSEDQNSGLLLGCIGDQCEECIAGILNETNMIATVKLDIKLDYALDIAITRMLRRRIADQNDPTVGGYPNMAIIDEDEARYAYVIQDQDHAFFRGLPLTRSDLPLVPQPHYHHDWRRQPLYDPAVPIG